MASRDQHGCAQWSSARDALLSAAVLLTLAVGCGPNAPPPPTPAGGAKPAPAADPVKTPPADTTSVRETSAERDTPWAPKWTPSPDGEPRLTVLLDAGPDLPRKLTHHGATVTVSGLRSPSVALHGEARVTLVEQAAGPGTAQTWTAESEHLRNGHILSIQWLMGSLDPIYVYRPSFCGTLDLGALSGRDTAPVIAAGRVVDAQGHGIADVRLTPRWGPPDGRSKLINHNTTTTSGPDGTFALRAWVHGFEHIELITSGGWSTADPVGVQIGARNVRVEVRALAQVTGTLVAADIPLHELEIVVKGDGAGASSTRVKPHAPMTKHGDGLLRFPARSEFKVVGLPPGRYAFEVRRADTRKALAKHTDVEIKAGPVTLPRLKIDQPTREINVQVLLPDGSPAANAKVWMRGTSVGERFAKPSVADRDGLIRRTSLEPAMEIAVHAPGHKYVFLTTEDDDLTIQLEKASPTRVTVNVAAPPKSSTSAQTTYSIALSWVGAPSLPRAALWPDASDPDPRTGTEVELQLDGKTAARGNVMTAGWYQIWMRASQPRRSKSHGTSQNYIRIDGSGAAVELEPLGDGWPTIND